MLAAFCAGRIFEKTIKEKIDLDETIIKKTKDYLFLLEKSWPKNLPQGIIHADIRLDIFSIVLYNSWKKILGGMNHE